MLNKEPPGAAGGKCSPGDGAGSGKGTQHSCVQGWAPTLPTGSDGHRKAGNGLGPRAKMPHFVTCLLAGCEAGWTYHRASSCNLGCSTRANCISGGRDSGSSLQVLGPPQLRTPGLLWDLQEVLPCLLLCRSGMPDWTLTHRELLIHAFPSPGIQRGESTTVPQWKQEWSCGYQPAAEQLSHFLTDFSPLGVSVVGTFVTCFSCQLQLYLCSLHGNTVPLALLCCCTTSWESSAVTRTGASRSLLYLILAG